MLSYKFPLLSICLLAVALVAGATPAPVCASIVYVKAGPEPGTENGESWPTAWNTLQEGIAHANDYDILWVAKGTYKAGSSYGDSFVFEGAPPYPQTPKRLQLYGGLAGTETTQEFNPPYVDHRDFLVNESILSGDLDGTSHSQIIVSFTDVNADWRLDGFTLTRCRSHAGNEGHAIKCMNSRPQLYNLLIRYNTSSNVGAGLYIDGALTLPTDITACTFRENTASGSGGAVWCGDGLPQFTDCLFYANESNASGGAVFSSGNPKFSGCTFTANGAWGNYAGAIRALHLDLRDCTFESNLAQTGGGAVACDYGGTVLIVKSRFSNNAAVEGVGGGLLFEGASVRLLDCEVIANSAVGDGGGVYVWEIENDHGIEMTNCLIARNRTNAGGGGVYYKYDHPTIEPISKFINCTIADNQAFPPNG